jgi:ATP-dependent exoDNAse (exonuclease V) beta subunit
MVFTGSFAGRPEVRGNVAKLLADAPHTESVAARERRELTRRELYVGMTRAREGLWIGSLGRA